MIHTFSHAEINTLVERLAATILDHWSRTRISDKVKVFPIPRGGIPVAYLLKSHLGTLMEIVATPEECNVFVDDLIDSGATMHSWCDKFPGIPFLVLVDKVCSDEFKGEWLVFPWEGNEVASIEDNIRRLLQYVGEDAGREGLLETPTRVAKAWAHWCSGYSKDAGKLLKVFEDGAETYDQMVTVKDIPIYSHCEHHLAPIIGTVSISYIPNGKIVGLSKLSRLADMYARRLQVQERLTDQIADALMTHLEPVGVGVVIKARHLCMESRGVCQQGHHTVTTALRGAIKDDAQARAEFLQMAG